MIPTLWQQFGEGPFLFQHDNAPVHKASSIHEWLVEIGVEELHKALTFKNVKHLWDELER